MIVLKVIACTLLTIFFTADFLAHAGKEFREDIRVSLMIATGFFICLMLIAL